MYAIIIVCSFVQILHVSGNHWLTVSNIGCKPAHVNVYDSLLTGYLDTHAKQQIASILFTDEPDITASFQNVQEQRGHSDCGVFALAFATSLCTGEDPVENTYVQHLL